MRPMALPLVGKIELKRGYMDGITILHLEDNANDAILVRRQLESEHLKCKIDRVWSRDAFELALRSQAYDIILSGFSPAGFDGLSALRIAAAARPDLPFIFVSGTIGEE